MEKIQKLDLRRCSSVHDVDVSETGCLMRVCCGASRGFSISVTDNTNQVSAYTADIHILTMLLQVLGCGY